MVEAYSPHPRLSHTRVCKCLLISARSIDTCKTISTLGSAKVDRTEGPSQAFSYKFSVVLDTH